MLSRTFYGGGTDKKLEKDSQGGASLLVRFLQI
jgi:hypothetical protein